MHKTTINTSELFIVTILISERNVSSVIELLNYIPTSSGMSFVIYQNYEIISNIKFIKQVAETAKMEVVVVGSVDRIVMQPNCIYVAKYNKSILIDEEFIQLSTQKSTDGVSSYFHSVSELLNEKCIGIFYSCSASNAAKYIKQCGGTVICLNSDEKKSECNGQAKFLIDNTFVDYESVPRRIEDLLLKLANDDQLISKSHLGVVYYNKILREVFKISGIDFSKYKRNTILRRLEKRMNLHKISNLSEYLNFISENDFEKEALKQDFLIRVSSFFRNHEAFKSIKEKVVPAIVKTKKESEVIRIWVAGCSTGEEVYSLAILFDEYIESNKLNIEIKLFASDIDIEALSIARNGRYNLEYINTIDDCYVDKYFDKIGDNIQIISRIRKKIVFLNHNLLKDSPFIRLDLISCRNLLIYLNSEVQRKIMMNFQFALNHSGFLFLGNSETLGDLKKYFSAIDSKWKIFQSISETKIARLQSRIIIEPSNVIHKPITEPLVRLQLNNREKTNDIFHRYLSKKYSPDCIFFDRNFNILFLKGDAGKRLCLQEGVFQSNLLNMVSISIATIIRNSVRKLIEQNEDIIVKNISNIVNGEHIVFDLIFHKSIDNELHEVYLLQFSNDRVGENEPVEILNVPFDDISAQRINDLENEIKENRLLLQDTVEELETSNEELQSSNEELMASIEEMRTINEEYQYVNDELVNKNIELEKLNNDINNLLTSTAITTIFVDSEFKIRKFTPSIKKLFNIQEENVNQPISSFSSSFNDETRNEIIADLKTVLESASVIEKEIEDLKGNIFIRRISPFITAEMHIDGCVVTFIDITTLKQTESELSHTQKLYELATDATNVGVWEWAIKADKWSGNNRWKELLGVSNNNVFDSLYFNMDKRDIPLCKKEFKEHISRKTELCSIEFRYVHPTTKTVAWLAIKGKVIERTSNGVPLRMIGIINDITPQKNIIENLVAQKHFSNRLAEASPSGVCIREIESGRRTFMNSQYQAILGYTLDEINIYSNIKKLTLIHPEDREIYESHLASIISGAEQVAVEARFKHKDGTWIWCLSIDSPFDRNSKGEVVSYIGILLDISKRKLREAKLIRYKKSIEASTDAIEILSIDGIHDYQNAAFSSMFGYNYKETKGKQISQFFSDKSEASEIFTSVSNQNSWNGETKIVTKKGVIIDVHLRADAIKDRNEVIIGFVFAYTDITKRKRAEKALIDAAKIAENASIQKNYFLANMSHEIRTPINGIVGFADLLKNDHITADAKRKYLNIIDSNSKQLLALINDILDVAKIEAGELTVVYGECRLDELLKNLEANFNQILAHQNLYDIKFIYDEPSDKALGIIKTDPLRLRQVLVNLLSNAQKFTEMGEIHFGYKIKDQIIEFYVEDSGIGISDDKLNEIFIRFKQATCDISAVYGGSGLGLAISKGIVTLLGGNIYVESEIDKGSKFTFTIPLVMMEEMKRSKAIFKKSLKGMKLDKKTVLVADDDISVQTYFEAVLEPYNVTILIANNGKEAVDIYTSTPSIDLVLLDIRMPVMNGFTALNEILNFDSNAIVIVQSAYVMLDEREQCLDMGCKEYLEKPLDRFMLIDTLEKWIN